MWFSRAGYTGVDTTDSEDGHDTVELKADAFSSKRSNRMFTWQNIAGIAGWVVAFIFSLIIAMQDSRLTDQGDCFMQTSAYSPLLDYIPHSFIHTKTNGTLDFPSVYRGTPSQELDEAWDSISIFRPLDVDVSEEQYLKFGSSPESAVRNERQYGGGLFLQPEFSHQLHCVNLLRRSSYFNYEYYYNHTFDLHGNSEDSIREHLDHCVEIIRQFVMCHADIGLVASHWIEGINHPWPDFNTNKVCRNFDDILEWTLEHQSPLDTPQIPKKPHGVKSLAQPP